MSEKKKIKVIFVGSKAVGKTSLISQYVNESFTEIYLLVIGVDKSRKKIKIGNEEVTLEIFDTAGQEDYRSVNKLFMKNTQIALIVYDITNKQSYEKLNEWINVVQNSNKNSEIVFGIAANKSDLFEKRKVSKQEGEQFAKENNSLFFETSAKDYDSINNVMNKLTEKYLEKQKEKSSKETLDNPPIKEIVPDIKELINSVDKNESVLPHLKPCFKCSIS